MRWEKKAENYLAFIQFACAQLIFFKITVYGYGLSQAFQRGYLVPKLGVPERIRSFLPSSAYNCLASPYKVSPLSCSPMLAFSRFQWGGEKEHPAPREDRPRAPR